MVSFDTILPGAPGKRVGSWEQNPTRTHLKVYHQCGVESEDYANPIEPSGRGGAKIARAIAQVMGLLDATGSR